MEHDYKVGRSHYVRSHRPWSWILHLFWKKQEIHEKIKKGSHNLILDFKVKIILAAVCGMDCRSKNGHKKSCYEAIVVVQARNDGGSKLRWASGEGSRARVHWGGRMSAVSWVSGVRDDHTHPWEVTSWQKVWHL